MDEIKKLNNTIGSNKFKKITYHNRFKEDGKVGEERNRKIQKGYLIN
jgi:hypothetical protein